MKRFLWLLLFSPLMSFAQVSPKMVCTNIKVSGDSLNYDSTNIRFVGFLEGEGTNVLRFFSNNEMSIDVIFIIETINSKRSSVKCGAIRIKIVYFLVAGNSSDKRKTERIIYSNSTIDCDMVENFVYSDGLKNKRVTLSYKLTKQ